MSTAAAEITEQIDDPTAFERNSTSVVFLSRRKELRLVRVPRYPVLAPGSARQVGEQAGECVDFHDGQFSCPREGEVRLEDGRKVDAAEMLEWLEGHKLNGDVNGGFWRVDPQAPAVSQAELQALVTAATDYDEEALERILEAEREGWQREQILNVATGALERVRKVNELAAREAQLVEREAAVAAAEAGGAPEAPAEAPPADAPPILGGLATALHEQAEGTIEDAPPETE